MASDKVLQLNDAEFDSAIGSDQPTLVDFWAAWCRPCRAENPNIVKVYNKYKDKGLSVLGVSLDRKATDWKNAIEQDGLDWHHVSNVRYFDEIAEHCGLNRARQLNTIVQVLGNQIVADSRRDAGGTF